VHEHTLDYRRLGGREKNSQARIVAPHACERGIPVRQGPLGVHGPRQGRDHPRSLWAPDAGLGGWGSGTARRLPGCSAEAGRGCSSLSRERAERRSHWRTNWRTKSRFGST